MGKQHFKPSNIGDPPRVVQENIDGNLEVLKSKIGNIWVDADYECEMAMPCYHKFTAQCTTDTVVGTGEFTFQESIDGIHWVDMNETISVAGSTSTLTEITPTAGVQWIKAIYDGAATSGQFSLVFGSNNADGTN